MDLDLKNSETSKHLIASYIGLLTLFIILWVVDSHNIDRQQRLISSQENSVQKMRLIADMLEIVRTRARLSYAMLEMDDIFEKDETASELSNLAGNFIQKRQHLMKLPFDTLEQSILQGHKDTIPVVIDGLARVTDLALAETEEANAKARKIIIYDIAPSQLKVIDSFMKLLEKIKNDVQLAVKSSEKLNSQSTIIRNTLTGFIFISSVMILFWTIDKIHQIEQKLYRLSNMDSLTSIANRRYFDYRLDEEWNRSLRSNKSLSLLLIDIDYFKKYNDYYGHQVGDECLIQVATIIKNSIARTTDLAARYGGEEFAVILFNTDEKGALEVAEHIRQNIQQENLPHLASSLDQKVSISIGQSTMTASKKQSQETLITTADQALYQAKQEGRNRVIGFAKQTQQLKLA